jgi:ADP-ribose pyrophosphatase YjhB (NUDIX family)
MQSINENPEFKAAYERLECVSLNPRRHTAKNAREHSEAVAARAVQLAKQNGYSPADVELMHNLGYMHDIGKIAGTAKPQKSVELLRSFGITDEHFLALVKWHDVSLPWWLSHQRGQAPSIKAWAKLAREVDLRMLCLFMVADRVDAPGGWRRNEPSIWFLEEAERRCGVTGLILDSENYPSVISAGCALVRKGEGEPEALVIRVRAESFELPKGGIEWNETPEEAATRELREETCLENEMVAGAELGAVDYLIDKDGEVLPKRVRYFSMALAGSPAFGKRPKPTRELRWIRRSDLNALPLVNDELRPLIAKALEEAQRHD